MNTFNALYREWRFLLTSKTIVGALTLLSVITTLALLLGNAEVSRQQTAIERFRILDAADRLTNQQQATDFGGAAYATFHATWNPPDELTFLTMGQRDVMPWMLRVRALAIEGQIHESDDFNPELALSGRFDFAFVVAFLLPLFAILLLYDLVSAEREAGRLTLLTSTAGSAGRFWLLRIAVRVLSLLICCLLPLWLLGFTVGTESGGLLAASAVVAGSLLLWSLLILVVAFRPWSSPAIATSLTGLWLVLALLLPLAGKVAVDGLVPGIDGAEIALLQRETVNGAWDLPHEVTMEKFVSSHPEWADKAAVDQPFHWKWYYAFQQIGDETAADLSLAYRDAIDNRDKLAGMVGLVSPPVAALRLLQQIAGSDVQSSLQYDARIRAYHSAIRRYYYPLLFNDVAFSHEALQGLPAFAEFQD